jgi:hypothetical protein
VTSSPWPFRIGLALGAPLMAVGIRGALVNHTDTHPAELARWVIGSAVVHDAALVPIVAVVTWTIRRLLPTWAWPAVRWALFATAVLTVVSRPFVGRYGWNPANPSALDRPYGEGMVVVLVLVWASAAGWLLIDASLHRRHRRSQARSR